MSVYVHDNVNACVFWGEWHDNSCVATATSCAADSGCPDFFGNCAVNPVNPVVSTAGGR